MARRDLFPTSPPPRRPTVPTAEAVRPRLDAVLAQLADGRAAAWTEAERRRWGVVFPQMCAWLPEAEREAKRASFRRLTGAA